MPSAKFGEKGALTLEPQGLQLAISRRHFGDIFGESVHLYNTLHIITNDL